MVNSIVKMMAAVVFFTQALVAVGYAENPGREIRIATFPCADAVSSFKKFHPLVSYLQERTQMNAMLVFLNDTASYERALTNGELDFVLQDPHVYARLADLYDKDSLLRTLSSEGKNYQYGIVIARKDGGIHSLSQLRGRTVMFGPRSSSPRWIAAKELFLASGIDIDTDLKGYSNGGCCEDVAFNVYLKEVDAGVVCGHFLSGQSARHKKLGGDPGQIVAVAKTKPVPTKVFCATKKVEPEIVAQVNQALLELDPARPSDREILENAELGGFQKAGGRDLQEIQELLDAVSGR